MAVMERDRLIWFIVLCVTMFIGFFMSKSAVTTLNDPSPRYLKNKATTNGRHIGLAGHNLTCLPSYSTPFQNTLLVIEFTVRLPRSLERDIERVYSCFFPNIVRYTHCDPTNSTEVENGMTCLKDRSPNFHPAYSPSWFEFEFMADAIQRHPNFEGYFFMQEDVVLNFWNFPNRLDFNKVLRAFGFADPDTDVWHKHRNFSLVDPSTIPEIATSFINPTVTPLEKIREFVDGFSTNEKRQLYAANSMDGKPMFRMANSDFYYLPKKYARAVLPHFERARVLKIFQEVAVPVVLDAIVPPEDYVETSAATLFRVKDSKEKMALYNPCWDYFHKMKISIDREFEWLVETVFRYGPMLHCWDCLDSGKGGITSYARIRY